MYILIRREEKKGKHYEHTFYSPQIPRLIGYTNYRNATERFQWKIVAGDVWEWRQINRNYRVLDYIPIVNAIKSFVLQLKYKIYKNEMCIGNAFLMEYIVKIISKSIIKNIFVVLVIPILYVLSKNINGQLKMINVKRWLILNKNMVDLFTKLRG